MAALWEVMEDLWDRHMEVVLVMGRRLINDNFLKVYKYFKFCKNFYNINILYKELLINSFDYKMTKTDRSNCISIYDKSVI